VQAKAKGATAWQTATGLRQQSGNQEEYRLPKLSDISSTRARRQLKVEISQV
jgi:hypothetical protein